MNDPKRGERVKESKILIVDDIELNRKLLETTLRRAGYHHLYFATNGQEALELTHLHRPDLVILDIMMPTMDGFAYCSAVQQDESLSNMPIIVQTVLDEIEKKLLAFRLGAADYICKPIEPMELLARTQVHLNHKLLLESERRHAARIHREMDAARETQIRLMPSKKQLHLCERMYNLEIAAHFQTSTELGGDGWGVQPLSETHMALWCYDFSGHGILAAMNVFRMQVIMQECWQYAGDPSRYVSHLNKRLCGLLEKHEFATLFFAVLDMESNCMVYASAAAPPAILSIDANNHVILPTAGLPLAVIPEATYKTHYMPFPSGSVLLLFSDGLIETPDESGEMITEEYLGNAIQKNREHFPAIGASLKKDLVGMLEKRAEFIKDDITLAVIQRR